jgi:hypothetical protein
MHRPHGRVEIARHAEIVPAHHWRKALGNPTQALGPCVINPVYGIEVAILT